MTINETLSLIKAVRQRLSGLKQLRSEVSTEETLYYQQDEKKVKEPRYDVKKVDAKISELEVFLYKADSMIKQKNAVTHIELNFDGNELLKPLE